MTTPSAVGWGPTTGLFSVFEQLRRDHVELSGISRALRAILAAPQLGDPAGLARLRLRLTRIITRHLAIEDAHVYVPLALDPRPAAQAIAHRFQTELRFLHSDFEAHLLRWTADALDQDWPGYRRSATQLLDALDARIRCEEEEVYPLVAGTSCHRTTAL